MEHTDLMIWDLVYATSYKYDENNHVVNVNIPSRITSISLDNGSWSVNPINLKDSQEYNSFHAIEPIPLTKDILLKNGFENPNWDNEGVIYKLNFIRLYYNIHKMYYFIETPDVHIHIKYVHELQHLLRLCRYTGLAINFKI